MKNDNFLLDFTIGGISAGIGKTLTAPIDRIKIILQTQNANINIINSKKKNYTGIINCFLRTYKETGIKSFWRGNSVNLLRYMPTQAGNFAFKNFYKKLFSKKTNFNFFLKNLLSGGFAGMTSSLIVYPLDFIRTRLASDIGKEKKNREFKGFKDCVKKIYKKNSIKGFYKGITISLPSIFVYRALLFGLYDSGKKKKIFENEIFKFIFAFLVTSFSSSVLYPLDTVKRSMMLQSGKNLKDVIYDNYFDCFKDIWKKEGIFGFYRGGLTNVFRGMGASLFLILSDFFKKSIVINK